MRPIPDVLYNYFCSEVAPTLKKDPSFRAREEIASQAFSALEQTFTAAQRRLFLAWEAENNALMAEQEHFCFLWALRLGRS